MPLIAKSITRTIPDNGLKPRRSVRFAAGSLTDTKTAAVRVSAGRGAPVWIFGTYYGLRIEATEPQLPSGQSMEKIQAQYDPVRHEYTITQTHVYNSWAE